MRRLTHKEAIFQLKLKSLNLSLCNLTPDSLCLLGDNISKMLHKGASYFLKKKILVPDISMGQSINSHLMKQNPQGSHNRIKD